MLAGAQTVHIYYRPLEDLELYIQKEKSRQEKVEEERN